MSDTQTAPQVADPAQKIEPKRPRLFGLDIDLTEAEGYTVQTLLLYQYANDDAELLARLQAWETLQAEVDSYRRGDFSYTNAVAMVGPEYAAEYFAAVVTIAGLFPVFGNHPERYTEGTDNG